MQRQYFKTQFAEQIFRSKYSQGPNDDWGALAERVVDDVCLEFNSLFIVA